MNEDSGMRWDRAMQACIKKDIEAVQKDYPYLVRRISYQNVSLDIGNWISENVGCDMIVVSKEPQGPAQNFPPSLITYAFRYEADAVAFKIKFGANDL